MKDKPDKFGQTVALMTAGAVGWLAVIIAFGLTHA